MAMNHIVMRWAADGAPTSANTDSALCSIVNLAIKGETPDLETASELSSKLSLRVAHKRSFSNIVLLGKDYAWEVRKEIFEEHCDSDIVDALLDEDETRTPLDSGTSAPVRAIALGDDIHPVAAELLFLYLHTYTHIITNPPKIENGLVYAGGRPQVYGTLTKHEKGVVIMDVCRMASRFHMSRLLTVMKYKFVTHLDAKGLEGDIMKTMYTYFDAKRGYSTDPALRDFGQILAYLCFKHRMFVGKYAAEFKALNGANGKLEDDFLTVAGEMTTAIAEYEFQLVQKMNVEEEDDG